MSAAVWCWWAGRRFWFRVVGGDSGTCVGRGGGVLSCLRRVGSPGACARLGVGRRGGCGYRARLWCGTRCVDARGSPSVLGRPALITTQSVRLVCPLLRKKINHWALAVLLRGSDRCPTHVGSGCGLLVAGVVFCESWRGLVAAALHARGSNSLSPVQA